jgi:hypothetical protein
MLEKLLDKDLKSSNLSSDSLAGKCSQFICDSVWTVCNGVRSFLLLLAVLRRLLPPFFDFLLPAPITSELWEISDPVFVKTFGDMVAAAVGVMVLVSVATADNIAVGLTTGNSIGADTTGSACMLDRVLTCDCSMVAVSAV